MTRPKRASSSARAASRATSASSSSTISGISRICRATPVCVERRLHALVDDALMRGVLVDDDQAVARLRHDVGLVHLRARGAERPLDQIGRRLEAFDARVGRRRADVEGRLRGFGKAERGAPPRDVRKAQRPRRRAPPVVSAAPRHAERAERGDGRAAAGRGGALALARQRLLQRAHDQRRAPARRRGSAPRSWPDAR